MWMFFQCNNPIRFYFSYFKFLQRGKYFKSQIVLKTMKQNTRKEENKECNTIIILYLYGRGGETIEGVY